MWDLLLGKDPVLHAVWDKEADDPPSIFTPAAAVPAVFAAVGADPLRAAIDALNAAAVTVGASYPGLFEELRRAFPALS